MENKILKFRVMVRFIDPDNLPRLFTTEDYLEGHIVAMIPGPAENNWVLRLRSSIVCYDASGVQHEASDFLLRPMGIDDEKVMAKSPWDIGIADIKDLEALAMLLKDEKWPSEIRAYEDYKKYPMISAAIIRIDKSKNVNLRIV